MVFSGYYGFLHHDIIEILLKVAFNTINHSILVNTISTHYRHQDMSNKHIDALI